MWTIYAYEVGFAAVVLVSLLAAIIGLWSRDRSLHSPERPNILSDDARSTLLSIREAKVRDQAVGRALAENPEDARMRHIAKKAAKAARRSLIQQAASTSTDT